MSLYAIDELMKQTRKLAADYYKTKQQSLPVSAELARYDACRLLGMSEVREATKGVDAIDSEQQPVQIKSRVIFDATKSGQRIGQINMEGEWASVLLVLFDPEYQPMEIYQAQRNAIELEQPDKETRAKRGAMSVAKFKKIGQRIWMNANDAQSN